MSVRLRNRMIEIGVEECCLASDAAAAWLATHRNQVFKVHGDSRAIRLHALGPAADACREPINITSKVAKPFDLISNFAHTPFILDGESYASIEGFWQGLKFPEEADRRRLAALHGSKAKDDGFRAPAADVILYRDDVVRVGTWDHWRLMERATLAKFTQVERAREALLSTGARPLTHQIGRDSRTIPGVIMADIWMRVRSQLGGG